jgi:hypothetical protein
VDVIRGRHCRMRGPLSTTTIHQHLLSYSTPPLAVGCLSNVSV